MWHKRSISTSKDPCLRLARSFSVTSKPPVLHKTLHFTQIIPETMCHVQTFHVSYEAKKFLVEIVVNPKTHNWNSLSQDTWCVHTDNASMHIACKNCWHTKILRCNLWYLKRLYKNSPFRFQASDIREKVRHSGNTITWPH